MVGPLSSLLVRTLDYGSSGRWFESLERYKELFEQYQNQKKTKEHKQKDKSKPAPEAAPSETPRPTSQPHGPVQEEDIR